MESQRDAEEKLMEAQAVPIIIWDKVQKCLVFEEILLMNILKHEIVHDLPVVLISIAGKKRSGKSFLLNYLLRYFDDNKATSPNPADTHDPRIIDFTVNQRLFPVPVDGSEVQPGKPSSPRYIRISVPKAVLAIPYKYKPKSECSFDSLALPHHCKPGHKYTADAATKIKLPQNSPHLDLKTSLQFDHLPHNGRDPILRKTLFSSSTTHNKSTSQDLLNDSYALQFKLMQLKN